MRTPLLFIIGSVMCYDIMIYHYIITEEEEREGG